jgi:hypothetical protein
MTDVSALLSGFGLSASAGLNAYIPLLVIALGARFFPQAIQLAKPFDLLTEPWAIAALIVLLVVEVLADKVPLVDHVNDAIALFIRPTAGAILFAASVGTVTTLDTRMALLAGLIVAGTTHAAKATARPVVTATTGGMGNPIVSTLEDVAALVTSLVAILAPLLIAVAFFVFALLFIIVISRRAPAVSG